MRRFWDVSNRQTLLIFFLLLGGLTLRPTEDPDLWWHLKVGQLIANDGLPLQDPFSFTAQANDWIVHEWLSDWLLWRLYDLAGLPVLSLFFAGVAAIAWLVVYRRCGGRPHLALGILSLGALAADSFGGARPQVFNLLFFAVFLYILEGQRRAEANGRDLLFLVPLTWLWANLHSGFLAGLALLIVYGLGEGIGPAIGLPRARWSMAARRRLLWLVPLTGLVSLLNPHTYHLLLFPFQTLGSDAIQQYVSEWHSPNFHLPYTRAFMALFLLGLLAWSMNVRQGERPPATHVLLFLGTAAAGLFSIRHIPLFSLVAVMVTSRLMAGRLAQEPTLRLVLLWAIAALALLLDTGPIYLPLIPAGLATVSAVSAHVMLNERWILFLQQPIGARLASQLPLLGWLAVLAVGLAVGWRSFGILAQNEAAIAARFPVAALDAVPAVGQEDTRLFNAYGWGGYLIWRDIPVFIDGRTELYGEPFFARYVQTYEGRPGWDVLLREYDINAALLPRTVPLATLLATSADWELVYGDAQAVYFEHK